MAVNWNSYFCRVNDEIASIFVDLELKHSAPDPKRPILAWVWLEMINPTPEGLSTSEEAKTLFIIDDKLDLALASLQACYCGRITTAGRRRFYYYLPSPNGFGLAIERAMMEFPDYKYKTDTQIDPAWNQYLNVLYPLPAQIQTIQNRKVITALTQAGDPLTEPREIVHYVYFLDNVKQIEYAAWAKSEGFATKLLAPMDIPKKRPFGVRLEREDRADQNCIDEVTMMLDERARACDGVYDGWESPVVGSKPVNPKPKLSLWQKLTKRN